MSLAKRAWLAFAAWVLVCSLIFWKPLDALAQYAFNDPDASHILIIPFIVAWLLHLDRKALTHNAVEVKPASFFAIPAAALAAIVIFTPNYPTILVLPGLIVSFLLFLVAGFIAIFGANSAKSEWFALAFLAFAIPFPQQILNRFIYLLQAGSADVAEKIFDWTGVPALRDGFIFHMPRISIEVAAECSGIRSSIALLILALLVAHFSFSKFWKKAVFVLAGLVMMIIKNGVRIATLTILANYVNPDFLFGRLHKQGGVVFFLIGLALLLPVYQLLRRGEPSMGTFIAKTSASPS
jgi:exosortase